MISYSHSERILFVLAKDDSPQSGEEAFVTVVDLTYFAISRVVVQ